MKRMLCMLLILCALSALFGCGGETETPVVTRPPISLPTVGIAENPTVGTTQPAVQVTDPVIQTTQATEAVTQPTGYILEVKCHDELIFDSPTYDGFCVGTVQQAGSYTIVDQEQDDEGYHWGKLKSGAGWINLDQVQAHNTSLLVSAAELTYTPAEQCHSFGQKSPYSVSIIIHVYQKVTDVMVMPVHWNGEGYTHDPILYALSEMTPDKPMVLQLEFPGDMSMYSFCFTANGVNYSYRLGQNGRNNAIDFVPYTP